MFPRQDLRFPSETRQTFLTLEERDTETVKTTTTPDAVYACVVHVRLSD